MYPEEYGYTCRNDGCWGKAPRGGYCSSCANKMLKEQDRPSSEDTAIAMLASLSDERLRAELERREEERDGPARALYTFWYPTSEGYDGWDNIPDWERAKTRQAVKLVREWKAGGK